MAVGHGDGHGRRIQVALSRSHGVAKSLLGAVVRGTVITDRYLGYRFVGLERRQVCWGAT